jgi:hypothetical protein
MDAYVNTWTHMLSLHLFFSVLSEPLSRFEKKKNKSKRGRRAHTEMITPHPLVPVPQTLGPKVEASSGSIYCTRRCDGQRKSFITVVMASESIRRVIVHLGLTTFSCPERYSTHVRQYNGMYIPSPHSSIRHDCLEMYSRPLLSR